MQNSAEVPLILSFSQREKESSLWESMCLAKSSVSIRRVVVIVAIDVRGAHAPSRADFGASPKCFSKTNQENLWRGANDSTRGVCAPQTSSATITTTRRIETEDFAKHILSQRDDSFSRWEKVRMRALLRNFASSI